MRPTPVRRRLGVAALIVATLAIALLAALRLDTARLTANTDSVALRIGVVLVLVFLVLLITRYVVLLWLGYLHHIEARREIPVSTFAPPLTIIVPAFDEAEVIEAALQSLLELDYPEYEILVVDDGSTDATCEIASRAEGRRGSVEVRVVRQANRGKAAALNTGLAMARHDFVVCVDGDSRLEPDALTAAMRHFADPHVGAVAGNVKVVNRNNLWTRLQALEYIEGLNLARRAQGLLRVVNIIPGPVGIFRRDALARVGGYATDTFAEDADVTLELMTAGWHIVYEDRAVAWTEAPERLVELIKQRYRWTRGILQALRKRGSWLTTPARGRIVWVSLCAMLFEATCWPVVSVLGNTVFVIAALEAGAASGIFYWWLLLMMLDVAAALHTVAMEGEDLRLVPYAIPYRFVFIVFIDVAKLFATVEELARVRMTWGKLARAGRL